MSDCRDFATALVCYTTFGGRTETLIAHYEYGHDAAGNSVIVSSHFTQADGVTVVDVTDGTIAAGACQFPVGPYALAHGSMNFASGAFAPDFDPAGNGATWDYANVAIAQQQPQSITVLCIKGDRMAVNGVELVHDLTGRKSYLTEGMSVTFSVAQDVTFNEYLDTRLVINCLGDAAMLVTWTDV